MAKAGKNGSSDSSAAPPGETTASPSAASLDEVIHQKVRLGIVSLLAAMPGREAEFGYIKGRLALTDGNLSTHLTVLENNAYIAIDKGFVDKKPKTWVRLTAEGLQAFRGYVATLEQIIKMVD